MITKRLSLLLVAVLLMTTLPVAVLAESWLCPQCGMENSFNFCANCGFPRPEEPAANVTPPPEAPLPAGPDPTEKPGGSVPSLFSLLFQTATPTPEPTSLQTAPPPTPTVIPVTPSPTPVPTPVPAKSEWIRDFSVSSGIGVVQVDFSAYAAKNKGTYYVYYTYDQNDYHTWYTLRNGETSQQITVVPGEKILVGVYYDEADKGRPEFDVNELRPVTLYSTIPYTDLGFAEKSHVVNVEPSSGNPIQVTSLSVDDAGSLMTTIEFVWSFKISSDTRVDMLGVLRSPDNHIYTENVWYTWKPEDSGTRYRYTLKDLFDECAQYSTLKTGTYNFELYIDGRQAASVPVKVAKQRVLASTPTPKPTKTPTPKPTKTPTPRPTKTPTPKPRTFRVLTPTMNEGATTITWEDSENNGPYTVTVQHLGKKGNGAKQQFAYTSSKSATNGTVMVPCEPYNITVTDRSGKTATITFRPDMIYYPDFRITPEFTLKIKTPTGNKSGQIKSFSAADIKANLSSYDYGGYLKLGYPQIRYQRVTQWTLAYITPNGDAYVDGYFTDDIPSGRHYTYWNHYSMNYLFKYLINSYGYIPTGEYIWAIYFDGMQAGSTTFVIKN